MIGIIVQLTISWLIVWLFEKGNLGVLGFFPTRKRLLDFALFFSVTAICCSSGFVMRIFFAQQQWIVNPGLTANLVLEGVWWNIKSVLFEELIFRGVLFYILIKKLGPVKAIIISSIAFGIYHWFSQNAFGNPMQMIIVFFLTGTFGWVCAYGYSKTFSLYIPVAIHLGWNVTQQIVFSSGPIGNQIFIQATPQPEVSVSYFVFSLILLLPILSALFINYKLISRMKRTEMTTVN